MIEAIRALFLQLFAEENLPAILTGVSFAVTIGGMIALWRCWK